jgi:hypothetical protein
VLVKGQGLHLVQWSRGWLGANLRVDTLHSGRGHRQGRPLAVGTIAVT